MSKRHPNCKSVTLTEHSSEHRHPTLLLGNQSASTESPRGRTSGKNQEDQSIIQKQFRNREHAKPGYVAPDKENSKTIMKKIKVSSSKNKESEEKSARIAEEKDENSKNKRSKIKREPLPMKMRAFPQSFWQEPNTSGTVLPTSYCSALQEETDRSCHSLVVGKANTDLLFSLFQNVGEEPEKEKKLPVIKRGRPRKPKPPYQSVRAPKDEDPYFTPAIVSLILSKDEEKIVQEQKIMELISVAGENDGAPSNSSYSQRLSDLVVNL